LIKDSQFNDASGLVPPQTRIRSRSSPPLSDEPEAFVISTKLSSPSASPKGMKAAPPPPPAKPAMYTRAAGASNEHRPKSGGHSTARRLSDDEASYVRIMHGGSADVYKVIPSNTVLTMR
jgi:hypothetical protein